MRGIMGLLSGRQQSFVNQISTPIVYESTDYRQESGSDLGYTGRSDLSHVWCMLNSDNLVDGRLVDVFKIGQITRKGKRVIGHADVKVETSDRFKRMTKIYKFDSQDVGRRPSQRPQNEENASND